MNLAFLMETKTQPSFLCEPAAVLDHDRTRASHH